LPKVYVVGWGDGEGWFVEAENPAEALAIVEDWYKRIGWEMPCRSQAETYEVMPNTFEDFLERMRGPIEYRKMQVRHKQAKGRG